MHAWDSCHAMQYHAGNRKLKSVKCKSTCTRYTPASHFPCLGNPCCKNKHTIANYVGHLYSAYNNMYIHSTATLPSPQVSLRNTSDEQQLQLQLNTPKGYNSGRFILKYNCQFRESDPIEVSIRVLVLVVME